jgi:hypothetical protein
LPFEHAIIGVDLRNQLILQGAPPGAQLGQCISVDRDADPLHPGGRCHVTPAQQSSGQVNVWDHRRQKSGKTGHVRRTIIQDRCPLIRCPRATSEHQIDHFPLFGDGDAVQPEIFKGAKQPSAAYGWQTIRVAPELGEQIQHPLRHWPS